MAQTESRQAHWSDEVWEDYLESQRQKEYFKPKLTDDFLATLTELVKRDVCGGDTVETVDFARQCFYLADKEPPSDEQLDPYYRQDEGEANDVRSN